MSKRSLDKQANTVLNVIPVVMWKKTQFKVEDIIVIYNKKDKFRTFLFKKDFEIALLNEKLQQFYRIGWIWPSGGVALKRVCYQGG